MMQPMRTAMVGLVVAGMCGLFLAGCNSNNQQFTRLDGNGDGLLSKGEVNWNNDEYINDDDVYGVRPQRVDEFYQADVDDDGQLTREEFNAAMNAGRVPLWLILTILVGVIAVPLVVGDQLAKSLKMPDYGWKIGLVLCAVTAGSVITYYGWPPKLGIDLSGGVILVYEIDDEATAATSGAELQANEKVNVGDLVEALSRRINPGGVKEVVIRPYGDRQVEIIIPEVDPAEIDEIKRLVRQTGQLEFLIVANSRDHASLIEKAEKQMDTSDRKQNLDRFIRNDAGQIVARWVPVDKTKMKRGELQDYRGINLGTDILRARKSEGDQDRLNTPFEIVDKQLVSANLGSGDDANIKQAIDAARYYDVEALMAVNPREKLNLKGGHLRSASSGVDSGGGYAVNFVMNSEGQHLLGTLTGDNLPDKTNDFYRRMAIIMDNKVISAPRLLGVIRTNGQITGDFTQEEVEELVGILRAGKLPAVLRHEPIAENEVSPLLGADTIRKGSLAIGISLAAVLVFMLLYYRFAGIVACMALVVNLVLILGLMIAMKAAFTLPGLAGLVLTVGMSVDANVLIFERIREELNRGAALRMALRNGFAKATTTIVDANLTTLITAFVLYAIGTDQIRGFAVTLILGILISMFTAIFCSRIIFDIAERKRWITQLGMSRIIGNTSIDFIGKRKLAAACSLILIVVGLVALVARGRGIFDIDFNGGTAVQVMVKEPTATADIRKTVAPLPDASVFEVQIDDHERGTIFQIDTALTGEEEFQPAIGDVVLYRSSATDEVEEYEVTDVDEAGKTVGLKLRDGDETLEKVAWNDLVRDGVKITQAKLKELFGDQLVLHSMEIQSIESIADASDAQPDVDTTPDTGTGESDDNDRESSDSETDETPEPSDLDLTPPADTSSDLTPPSDDSTPDSDTTPETTGDGGSNDTEASDNAAPMDDTPESTEEGDAAETTPATESDAAPAGDDPAAPSADEASTEDAAPGDAPVREEQPSPPTPPQVDEADSSYLPPAGEMFVSVRTDRLLAQADTTEDADASETETAEPSTEGAGGDAPAEPNDDATTDEAATEDAATSATADDQVDAEGGADDSALVETDDQEPEAIEGVGGRTRAKLSFGHKLTAAAIRTEIETAAKSVLRMRDAPTIRVSNDEWDGVSGQQYANWTVELPVNEATARTILTRVQDKMAGEPVWLSSNKIGGKVAGDTQAKAIGALLLSLLFIIGYIWIRFQRVVFGLAAVVALVHDVLITLGAIAISLWLAKGLGFLLIDEFKISLPVVAAFLTIIGYSLNDTIVVFDRIREVRGKNPEINKEMINSSINQTLSRTLLTSVTTLLVVLILYILGGQGIHGFAFALVVGVIVGTYSSVFVASPALLWMAGLGKEDSRGSNKPATTDNV